MKLDLTASRERWSGAPAQRPLAALACGFAALIGSGCRIPAAIEQDALTEKVVRYNEAVASAHERVVLNNILRSAVRRPQHWSSVARVRGQESRSGEVTLSVPFGGDASDELGNSTKATVSSSPGFDLDSSISQDFLNGILSPLTLEQIAYFHDQGWPLDLLLCIAIREIRVVEVERAAVESPDAGAGVAAEGGAGSGQTDADKKKDAGPKFVASFLNRPSDSDPSALLRFSLLVSWLCTKEGGSLQLGTKKSRPQSVILTNVSGREVRLADLQSALESGARVAIDTEKDQLKLTAKQSTQRVLTFVQPADGWSQQFKRISGIDLVVGRSAEELKNIQLQADYGVEGKRRRRGSSKGTTLQIQLVPRSAEGIVYYLGQLARLQLGLDSDGLDDRAPDQGRVDQPLLVSATDARDELIDQLTVDIEAREPLDDEHAKSVVALFSMIRGEGGAVGRSTDFMGTTYSVSDAAIPGLTSKARSTTVLGVVQLLFGLQRESKDFPGTPVVVSQ